jgi:hypothetical protein
MKTIALAVIALLITPLGIIWSGYALTILWEWFIVSTFGIASLTIPVAVGIAIIINYLTKGYSGNEPEDTRTSEEKIIFSIVVAVLKPAFALLFGWVITWFM